jgi:nitrogen fixation NifU-like protein
VDLDELYQDVILDHSRRPRNFGELAGADARVHGDNPMCGDEITLQLKFDGDKIGAAAFTGSGCSICMASASMLTQKVKNRTRAESAELSQVFQQLVTGSKESSPDKRLGDLSLLQGVRKFPQRVKCATLAWHALDQALANPSANETQFSEDVGG